MPVFKAPTDDFLFLIRDMLGLDALADAAPELVAPRDDLAEPILQEAARLCEEVLFPLNQSGDEEGCRFDKGNVHVPKGFKDAYTLYRESGWPALTCDPAYGGQGLPEWLNMPVIEMICSANLSFGITPGLSHGAYNAIALHANDALKQKYLPKMVTGEWSGVMCLTEPQCGTDLGLIRTKAEPKKDGSYAITGNKIFISSGEQDVTENIIHLVLARLPGAPEGIRGISLFLVPKIMVGEDGALGKKNGVSCASIEHKMGIHASPTCVMNYDDAIGWLVGEPHKGMRSMFTMMNAARLYVGVQGVGLAEVSYQNALAYAKERLQGRALTGAVAKDKVADPLLVHPDIRRTLLTMKSVTEGMRALTMITALKLDLSHRHPDAKMREQADDFVQLMTPIIKAHFTDMGSEICNMGMQIFGGYGYVREYGMEQYVRDARIAQIYEGANGIQGLDLIGRKLPAHTGRYLRQAFHPMVAFIEAHRDNPDFAKMIKALSKQVDYLQKASLWMAQKGLGNPNEAASGASEYLRMFGVVYLGYLWAEMAVISAKKLEGIKVGGEGDAAFYQSKLQTAEFYIGKVLPQAASLLLSITAGAKPVMQMEEAGF